MADSKMLIVALLGPSADLVRCEDAVFQLRRFAVVAFDWPAQVRDDRDAGITDAMLSPMERIVARNACCEGIRRCHVALWLASPSIGASYESGFADALGKPIVIAGTPRHPIYGETIEDALRFDRDEDAILYLAGIAERMRC